MLTKTDPAAVQDAEPQPAPNLAEALRFLGKYHGDNLVVLTSIIPDGKTTTDTFHLPEDRAAIEGWLRTRQGVQNCYFSVNPPMQRMTNKTSKEHVARMVALHVDLDWRIGEDPAEEQARMQRALEAFSPKPSIVCASGGGAQAFWRLKPCEQLEINGSIEKAESLEVYNIQLERIFGGDHTHNVDRIMRIPGTINVPNKKKLAKGRVPALARLVSFDVDAVYDLAEFTPAPPEVKRSTSAKAKGRAAAAHAGMGLTELQAWAKQQGKVIPEYTQALIATGGDSNDSMRYGSRSEPLMRVVCDLVRADVPDEIIFAVITGPNKIAESVVEKRDWENYAQRQIDRGREECFSPELAELNARHCVLEQFGGKTRVLCWEASELNPAHQVPVLQTFEDFRNRYMHRRVQIGVSKTGEAVMGALGKWWLEHPQRRQFRTMRLLPGQGAEVDGDLNLWRGFGVPEEAGDWSLMKTHIREVVAGGDEASADYLLKWIAWAVQHPDLPAEVALVLCGGKGTGKGFFGRALVKLFGQHGLQVGQPAHVTGRFNAHLRSCCLLLSDEATRPGDKAGESVLKTLITEEAVTVENKHIDATAAKNRLKVVMASNDAWVVPASLDERRFAVFRLSEARAQDKAYFAALAREVDRGGLSAMLHELRRVDLGEWHPRDNVPQTEALRQQQIASLGGVDGVLFDLLSLGAMPGLREVTAAETPWVSTQELLDYIAQRIRAARDAHAITLNDVGDALKSLGASEYRMSINRDKRVRGWLLPQLAEARAKWDDTRVRATWDDATDWTATESFGAHDEPEQGGKPPF